MTWKYTKGHGNNIAKRPFGSPPTEITYELRPEDELETNKHSLSQYIAKLPDPEAELKNWVRDHRSLWEAGWSYKEHHLSLWDNFMVFTVL
jgi:hypothetical protein